MLLNPKAKNCPSCGGSWDAGEGFSHLIGIEVRGIYDGVLLYQCPCCQSRFQRFPKGDRRYDRAMAYGAKELEEHTNEQG